jgi:hypothetical protein
MFGAILMLVIFSVIPSEEKKGWQGIIPLHSTRADVERVLGRSRDPCNCIYETQEEFIYFDYATSPCKGSLPGWNVPTDTRSLESMRAAIPKATTMPWQPITRTTKRVLVTRLPKSETGQMVALFQHDYRRTP